MYVCQSNKTVARVARSRMWVEPCQPNKPQNGNLPADLFMHHLGLSFTLNMVSPCQSVFSLGYMRHMKNVRNVSICVITTILA